MMRRRAAPVMRLSPSAAAIATARMGTRSGIWEASTSHARSREGQTVSTSPSQRMIAPMPRRMSTIARSPWALSMSRPCSMSGPALDRHPAVR